MRTKTYQQITDQICRLMQDCKRNNKRRAAIARTGKLYIQNAFAYIMRPESSSIDIDVLQIPASVYAK